MNFIFKTVLVLFMTGLSAAAAEDGQDLSAPAADQADETSREEEAVSAAPEKEGLKEPLRDPFWPVGFFPDDWNKPEKKPGAPILDDAGREAAMKQIVVSGTSRMGGRIAVIINGQLKTEGDPVEVPHGGKVYRWNVLNIDSSGRVELEKTDVK